MWTIDWPVLSPILTGAAVAIWTRTNELHDRRIRARESERDYERVVAEQKYAKTQTHYSNITEAVITLVVEGDMYQAVIDAADSPPTPAQREKLDAHAAAFARAHTVVSLFAEPIASAATKFYNSCQAIIEDIGIPSGKRAVLDNEFTETKAALTVAARQFLHGRLDFM